MTCGIVRAFDFADDFLVQVEKCCVSSSDYERAFLAVKINAETSAFETARIAALAFPGDTAVAEVERRHINIGRFPVVIEVVAIPAARDAFRRVNAETPARKVERVDAVVAKFTRAPIPKPVPVVVKDIVLV